MSKLTALLILDGYGESPNKTGNAIALSGSPYIAAYREKYPSTLISASGKAVGLPDGQMGNSEVGHLNMGAGRVVFQELTRISNEIEEGEFFHNPELLWAMDNAKEAGKAVHLMGLLSDGGVHSHNSHLYALLEMAKRVGAKKVYLHCFMDGRDVSPYSGKGFIEELQGKIEAIGVGTIASVMGRYYAMDRDNRWDRVQKAYDAMVLGQGNKAYDAVLAMQQSYDAGITDEFVLPTVICDGKGPVGNIQPEDSVIFFNFRPDRAREITRTFIQKNFQEFERGRGYFPVTFVTLTQYDECFTNLQVAFKPQTLKNTLGEYLSTLDLIQLRIAETEKYAHVTSFFNGGDETPNPGEVRVLIPSPKVATYDLKPEMSAYEVAEEAVRRIESDQYDVIILNFANADMVGHTGMMDAAVKAIEAVDWCTHRVVEAVLKAGGQAIVTADHGNSDHMLTEDGNPVTAHSTNQVPFILVDPDQIGARLLPGGRLCDVAPTMLDMMGLEPPKEMTGRSLLVRE
ncbi:MAG: 2,3-bisphosphoglycerate-independent phosphoglycerate mutase [Christensenellales bacterium]|jgi:2,3-bisphosphoglycerate-independent phosphoglycerate mutase